MTGPHLRIALVGMGPRGLSALERLCANERKSPSHETVTVHIVDPYRPGPGQVWRTDQSRHLLMNTVASQITLFTDDSVRIEGPVETGPSLYDWARTVALMAPIGDALWRYDDQTLAEARDLGPDDYPTRAFYGHYLEAVHRQVVTGAPGHLTVVTHRTRALALDDDGTDEGHQVLTLEDGTRIAGLHAVVLAQGHVPCRPTAEEQALSALSRQAGLPHILPANPTDVDVSGIGAGTAVLLRGLGLNFFDYMALFTVGRGGSFRPAGDGRLVYRASGREPRLYAGSRRGVPYHARGENEKGPHGRHHPALLTAEAVERLRERARGGARVTFGTDLWPLVSAEVESVYYGTLLTSRGRDGERAELVRRYLETPPGPGREELLDSYGIAAADRWDWELLARPYAGRAFTGPDDFHGWLLERLRRDAREARAGNVSSPLKAALDVLRDLRNEVRLAVDHGGIDGDSYRAELQSWYTPLNAFLSIGPPASRIEEMAALVEAGVLTVLGPGVRVRVDADGPAFVAESDVPGSRVRAGVLIEARLPEPDLRRTEDPLMRHLLTAGQCRPYTIAAGPGEPYESGGLAVTERPYRLLDAAGRAHPRRYAYGIPTEAVHWVTAAGIRPGVDSVTLGDSDAIARAVLAGSTSPHDGTDEDLADSDLSGVRA
ncbi:FAD/NAD(P)-binding protein [Actinacidiphila sp. ITFR-21]|uniref:FAD/NAD(P)-binding protein n=1 Tax=Actinacidiphila sp. ITFR-21 TaxID=3075199 RepID=UPI00288A5E27|nr:FAD/NAD(P)-binding protein [Streptomyces sp. ITFR-21]WNI18890.1 FAD/NAD(P)-binding protein [Streptomyces sp. ITFR-21]